MTAISAEDARLFAQLIGSMLISKGYPESDEFKRGAKQYADHMVAYLDYLIDDDHEGDIAA